MTPYKHQIDVADRAYNILRQHGWVYIAAEERTGKTLSSVLIFEQSRAEKCLVLTKKKALDGWSETLEAYGYECMIGTWFKNGKSIKVTNYHQASKLSGNYDLIVLDEAHSYLSAYPKTGKIWKDVYKVAYGKPIIYMSATPYAESLSQLYNQLRLSAWSPWKEYKNFYQWHRLYGKPDKTRTPYGLVDTYKKVKEDMVLRDVEDKFIKLTRRDIGFEYEPTDHLHYVELQPNTKELIKQAIKTDMFIYSALGIEEPLDTPMKQRTTVYMIEGGVIKAEGKYYELPNCEKIEYIKEKWGDTDDMVIMHHFVAEGQKLEKHFKNATILQGDRWAEGVDLSHKKYLIIYSMSFSTSRYIQRRARQANKNRKEPIDVHFLLVKGGISEAVYDSVAKKRTNFTKNSYERWANTID